jgi:hypothetical protein
MLFTFLTVLNSLRKCFCFCFYDFSESHSVPHKTNQSVIKVSCFRQNFSFWTESHLTSMTMCAACTYFVSSKLYLFLVREFSVGFPKRVHFAENTLDERCGKPVTQRAYCWSKGTDRIRKVTCHKWQLITVLIPYYLLPDDFLIACCSDVREGDSSGQCFRELCWLEVSRYSFCI